MPIMFVMQSKCLFEDIYIPIDIQADLGVKVSIFSITLTCQLFTVMTDHRLRNAQFCKSKKTQWLPALSALCKHIRMFHTE